MSLLRAVTGNDSNGNELLRSVPAPSTENDAAQRETVRLRENFSNQELTSGATSVYISPIGYITEW